jgi:acyl-CoA reductase-like NAD-dependent aldehyde dehydrogenase
MTDRIAVRRTPKLFVGGSFPRSESGRSYEVLAADGAFLAQAARASRKDARDAVVAARAAQPGWAGATAYNRGQVLYRVAELLEGRRDQLADEVDAAEGLGNDAALDQVDRCVDRLVWYAGWTDKVAVVDGSQNPVAGPYFSFTTPEPVGVVAAFAPERPSLLGLVSVLAPIVATGNTIVCVTSHAHPLPAVSLAEILATSDVPGGVVNLLTGDREEVAPRLASHRDVDALDLAGFAGADTTSFEEAAADSMTRVRRPGPVDEDWTAPQDPRRMLAFTEAKTVWHPIGT